MEILDLVPWRDCDTLGTKPLDLPAADGP